MKQKKAFKRGIHPYEGKEYSKDCPIKSIDASAVMVYPLSQHIGAPAKEVVSVGDRVLRGQLIAEAGGFVSSPVYSSVSGTVKAIEPRQVLSGGKVKSVIIENDNQYECVEGFGALRDASGLSAEEIIDIITKSGIVGLGGAGFPTAVKLTPKNAKSIDHLIINASECEPYLTSDYRLMLERGAEIVEGIKAVLKLFPKAKAVIGIEDNKPDAVKSMQELTSSYENIEVMPLKTKYPQGGERQLIYAVTGRKLNSKMLPADVKCVVVNAASCFAIYEAVCKNMPIVHRVMTITGEGVNSPCNVDVPLGISHADVLEACGGAKDNVSKFISGGPMMGMAMSTLDIPVVKTSSSILAFVTDEVAECQQSNCIHCGRCAAACPQFLVPQMMGKAVKANNDEQFESLKGMECIECGCCTYVCPAKIPLTQMFKLGKARLREKSKK